MSKIIVDEIQKNGGDTLTLPTTDASANNQPMVGSTGGVLSFSPLALPAADGDANKPVTTDGAAQLQFGAFALPATAGTDGQVLTSTGSAAAWEAVPAGFNASYEVDFTTSSASSVIILWTDIFGAGTTVSDIKMVQLYFQGISGTDNAHLRIYGRKSGADATAANYGQLFHTVYSSGTETAGSNTTSYMRMPIYNNTANTEYSYGSGLWGFFHLTPRKEGTYGNIGGNYQVSYEQATSYTYPTVEYGSFGNYSTNGTHDEWTEGMRVTASSGAWNRGKLIVLGRK